MRAKLRDFDWSRTRLIQVGLTGFLLGLWLAKLGWGVSGHLVLAAAITNILLLAKSRWAFLALFVLAVSGGIWRGQAVVGEIVEVEKLYGQEVVVVGAVEDDPTYGDRRQLEFHLSDIRILEDGKRKDLYGRLKIRGFAGPVKISRGDTVMATGKLRPTLGNRQGQISYAELELVGRKVSWLENIRGRFFAGINTTLPDPQGSLGLGFIVGLRVLLPESLLDQLSRTGLTHIVAVSGYNLTILVRLTRRLLAQYSKYLATASAFGLIIGFIAVTGLAPSIFRAAIVSGLALAGWYWGRKFKPMVLILASAAVTAGINPTYLWFDIGWWLSFLAFFGVLVLAPTLLSRFGRGSSHWLVQLLAETFSAQLLVLPIIAFIFGELSIISILANLIILPFIPFAMLLTFVAGVAGMATPLAAGWAAVPANAVLLGMVRVVEYLAALPFAATELTLTMWQMLALYAAILFFIASAKRASRFKPLSAEYSLV